MEFRVLIDCDNDAFLAYPEIEVAEILSKIGASVVEGKVSGKVIDHNGNTAGNWEFITE